MGASVNAEAVEHGGRLRLGRVDSLKRLLAMLLLPASILPVPLLGPTLLRAPQRLWRQARAEIQRLEAPAAPRATDHKAYRPPHGKGATR